jgi:cephalosporin-C deacetylase
MSQFDFMSQAILEQTRTEVKRPADFDAFWAGVQADLAEVPADWERMPGAGGETATHTVDWLRFSSLEDTLVYGWLATPKRRGSAAGSRGFLWLPGYSLGNPPPGPESLYPDTVTFGLNLHGNLPDTPYRHPSVSGADYITQGIESPQTYFYRTIIGHCLRALDILAAQPEVSPERVMVGGMSQGGGLALVTAALAPTVKLCLADMPWLCALDLALSLLDRAKYQKMKAARYPDARGLIADYADAHPELAHQIYQTYAYFDPLSHAANIRCPTQTSAGGRDPSCKPPTIYAVFNELRCVKEMLYLPTTGHDIVPAMHEAHEKWVQGI